MKKRTKRKIYPLVNPISHAIEGACVTDSALLVELRQGELEAIEAMRTGTATQEHWHQLNDTASLAELMSINGIGIEVYAAAKAAEEHLRDAVLRFRETGVMQMDAAGVLVLKDLQEYHDLQRQSIARSEYWMFIKQVIDLRTGRSPIVDVI